MELLLDPQIYIRILLSIVLGGIVGWERELHDKPAGLRTHILVSVSSALIMLLSIHTAEMYEGQGYLFDPGRVAAGVLTGIGFLGAGTIIRQGSIIRGLTTAASIWMIAAVGLAIGAGYYVPALLVVVLVETIFRIDFLHLLRGRREHEHVCVIFKEEEGTLAGIIGSLTKNNLNPASINMATHEDGKRELTALLSGTTPQANITLISEIESIVGVDSITFGR